MTSELRPDLTSEQGPVPVGAADLRGYSSLVELFDAVAARTPDAVAVISDGIAIAYAELEERSRNVARRLAQHGDLHRALVGLRVGRTATTVACILGIMRAGAAYVPIDSTYPVERISYMLDDAGVSLVVDGSSEGTSDIEVRDLTAGAVRFGIDVDAAYVAYTSGSTGRPKGCVITHANVLAFLDGALPIFAFGSEDRWSVFHSLSFDASVWELWGALATGGTAVIVQQEEAANPERFLELWENARITVVSVVASYFRFLLARYQKVSRRVPGPRYLFFVGEAIRLDLIRDFLMLSEASMTRCVNMYGPTETTVFASYKLILLEDTRSGPRSPIGAPLGHAQLAILDEHGRPSTTTELAGEIVIGGETVGSGYLHRPALTSERFPIINGTHWYRTGDLGRRLPSAEFEFLGRIDQQIKRRGFRVEIEEIEALLRESATVSDAAVCLCRVGLAELLVACIVPVAADTSAQDAVRGVRTRLQAVLPPVMLPDRYVMLPALPQNATGKLDRTAAQEQAEKHLKDPAYERL